MGSAVMRHYFLWLLMAIFCLVQFTYIMKAALNTNAFLASSKLPLTACVKSAKGGKPIGSTRDCMSGQGSECTYSQPCTPCSAGGCSACSTSVSAFQSGSANTGACYFVEGVGPYCLNPITGVVAACTTCCS